MSEAVLLQAVLDAPDDDAPRLRYAEWLAANGQGARAEFIRVQVELSRLEGLAEPDAAATEAEERLYDRAEEMIEEHAWHLGLPEIPGVEWGGGPHHGFERGFMTRVIVDDADAFCSRLGEVFAVAPVTKVQMDGANDAALTAVAGSPHLARLRGLRVTYGSVGDAGVLALAEAPYAARLRTLCLFACKVGPDGAAAIASSPHLAGLEDLTLNACPIGAAGAEAILRSPTLIRLELVDLRGCFPRAKNAALISALRERFGGGLLL